MAAPMEKKVELGFVEKVESWKVHCRFFPSKVGGKPAWLVLNNLPKIDEVTCISCSKPCSFLMQVYCPLGDKIRYFHRTVYIFVCKNTNCWKITADQKFVILRCQLPKVNSFYSDSPPDESCADKTEDTPNAEKYQCLCKVCGCAGNKRCCKCKAVTYCCKDHQILDWKNGHKIKCDTNDGAVTGEDNLRSNVLFPEYELITEPEEIAEEREKTESERLTDYEEFVQKHKSDLPDDGALSEDLSRMATAEDTEDNVFQSFKDRISHEPEQVLRYQLGGTPLFVSKENRPHASDIPNCQCGQPRRFEFQILPQLLSHLEVDSVGASMDWGTLLVYTCMDSCEPPPDQPYVHEFLWNQDFTNVHNAT